MVGSISGNARAPALPARLREGRVVGRLFGIGQVAGTGAVDEEGDGQVLGPLDEVAERDPRISHALLTGEEAGVEHDKALEPGRVLDEDTHADRATPVVDDERGPGEIEALEQRGNRRGMWPS